MDHICPECGYPVDYCPRCGDCLCWCICWRWAQATGDYLSTDELHQGVRKRVITVKPETDAL